MNRVKSGLYPNTISEVIYQSGQFTPAMTGWLPCPLDGAAPCRAKIVLGGVAALDRRKPGCAGRKPAFGRFWPISDFSGAARSPCPLNHETKPKGETP